MKFIENIFVSGIDDTETVFYSLKKNIPLFNIYLVLVDSEKQSVILSSYEYFKNDNYKDMYTAAVCSGKYNAYRTYEEMVKYAIKNNWNISDIGRNLIAEK